MIVCCFFQLVAEGEQHSHLPPRSSSMLGNKGTYVNGCSAEQGRKFCVIIEGRVRETRRPLHSPLWPAGHRWSRVEGDGCVSYVDSCSGHGVPPPPAASVDASNRFAVRVGLTRFLNVLCLNALPRLRKYFPQILFCLLTPQGNTD